VQKVNRTLAALLALCFGIVTPAFAQTKQSSADAGSRVRPQPPDERGVTGRRAKDVAAEMRTNRRSQAALEQGILDVADDEDAYVDSTGRAFFADFGIYSPALEAIAATEPVPAQIIDSPPTGNAFTLHSKPGSTHTIYLDFDGETVANNAWTDGKALTSKTVPPFDRDGFATFNTTELQYIINVWQGVSEDYAPFDVDITTERPPSTAISIDYAGDPTYGVMAVVTNENWLCGAGCVGVAYIDVFDATNSQSSRQYYSPAWAFPTATMPANALAQTISHEVGHNLGLGHDGTATASYYSGHNNWTPIMGSATGRQFTQWSRGEYANANNTEDDISIIASQTGSPADPAGGALATALLLPTVSTQSIAQTTIRDQFDVDLYRIDNTGGNSGVTVTFAPYSPNLYPTVRLLDNAGNVVLTAAQGTTNASLLLSGAPAGTYYLSIEPNSLLDASTGFTKYGSLGVYSVALNLSIVPSGLTGLTLTPTSDGVLSASWTPSTGSGNGPITYEIALCDAATCQAPTITSSTQVLLSSLPFGAQYFLKVRAINSGTLVGPFANSAYTTVLAKPIAPTPQRIRFTESTQSLAVDWSGAAQYGTATITNTSWVIRNRTTAATLSGTISGQIVGTTGTFTGIVPASWLENWIDVTMTSTTNAPSPFNTSTPTTGSIYLGRLAAPQATPPAAPPTRTAAPQAPPAGVPAPRGSAPQA
jgi:Metallo-peptidase family M12